MAVINGVPFVQSLFVWGTDTSTSEAASPVVSLCDLAVMYVIGFWLNKNLKLHTYCVTAKPALGAIGAGPARLSWLPTFGIPPLVPSKLLKEKDNRIRSGSLGSSIDCHIQEAAKKKKKETTTTTCAMGRWRRGEMSSAFTLCEERWHLGSAKVTGVGGEG